jgi:hypothetical protein
MTDHLRREDINTGQRVNLELFYDLHCFYAYEADLLDEGRYVDWLELFDDDLYYWSPTRTNRLRRQQALAIAGPDDAAFYDETKDSLAWRIRRFDSGMAWAEDPPSRTRHLITNLTATHATDRDNNEILMARTNFLVWRTRLENEQGIFAGTRTDLLRQTDAGFKVFDRRILLDINVLPAKNISTFF